MYEEESDDIVYIATPHYYLNSLSPVELETYSDAARMIQLWYSIFHPRFDTIQRSIIYRAIYDEGSGSEKLCAKVIQQWYRVYVVGLHDRYASRRESKAQLSQISNTTQDILQRDKSTRSDDIMTMVDVVNETVNVIHDWKATAEDEFIAIRDSLLDKDEENMLKELRYLASLRLRAIWDQDPKEYRLEFGKLVRPGDTLLHFLIQTLPEIPPLILQEFYREGLQLHEKGANERTLLHAAAHGGSIRTVQALVAEGVDVMAVDSYGCCALHDAAKVGAVEVVKYLVEYCKIDINIHNKNGRTPLHYAAEYNSMDVAEYLVTQGAHLNEINGNMRTPLHMAATRGHLEMVTYLLQSGAEIKQNLTGDTIFHDAAKYNHIRMMEMFVKQNRYARYSIAKNNQERTPLHMAAANRAVDVYLLLNGNPWEGKHAGLTKDVFGLYPLNLLIESDGLQLDPDLNMTKYVPRNSHDVHPIWHDDLFASILHESPEYAWAFLDAFKVAISWSCGQTEWAFPKLSDMYGQPNSVKKSTLEIIVDAYNRGDKDSQAHCIKCLSHLVLSRILHLKWKSYGRTMHFVEFFGSIFLLFVTTVCVSLSNVQVEFTKGKYSMLVVLWVWFFLFTAGAIHVSFHYSSIKRSILNASVLNPTTKQEIKPRRGFFYRFLPEKYLRRGSSIAYTFMRSNSTLRQVTPRIIGTGMDKNHAKRIILKDSVITAFIGFVLGISTLLFASTVGLFMLAYLGDSTVNAAANFFRFNTITRCLASFIYACMEGMEFHGCPRRYLSSLWSLMKVFVLLCIVFVETPLNLRLFEIPGIATADAEAILYAMTSLMQWINVLQVLRVNDSTGPMITMILNMVPDVIRFLMLYTVFQIGLTCAYFALLKGQNGFMTFGQSFVTTFLIIFGQLEVDVVLKQEYPRQFFITLCIMLHYIVVAIVLLNALIATLTMTAEVVLERVKEQVAYNHAESILRAEITLPQWLRTRLRSQAKAKKTKAKGSVFTKTIFIKDDLNEIEETMDESIKSMEKKIEKCLQDVKELAQRMHEMQSKVETTLAQETEQTQNKLDSIVLMLRTTQGHSSFYNGHRAALAPTPLS